MLEKTTRFDKLQNANESAGKNTFELSGDHCTTQNL